MFYRHTTPTFDVLLWRLLGSIHGLFWLRIRGYLPKSRTDAAYCPWHISILMLVFSCGAEVALWFPWAGPSCVFPLAAPPAVPTSIRAPVVRHHVAKAKTAITPVRHSLPTDPAGDPPDLNVGHLNQLQSLPFLQLDTRPSGVWRISWLETPSGSSPIHDRRNLLSLWGWSLAALCPPWNI